MGTKLGDVKKILRSKPLRPAITLSMMGDLYLYQLSRTLGRYNTAVVEQLRRLESVGFLTSRTTKGERGKNKILYRFNWSGEPIKLLLSDSLKRLSNRNLKKSQFRSFDTTINLYKYDIEGILQEGVINDVRNVLKSKHFKSKHPEGLIVNYRIGDDTTLDNSMAEKDIYPQLSEKLVKTPLIQKVLPRVLQMGNTEKWNEIQRIYTEGDTYKHEKDYLDELFYDNSLTSIYSSIDFIVMSLFSSKRDDLAQFLKKSILSKNDKSTLSDTWSQMNADIPPNSLDTILNYFDDKNYEHNLREVQTKRVKINELKSKSKNMYIRYTPS